ncbi:lachesin-like [Lutzomyia longipalpis]|uniref:lachesin-like n=1 Tax=Lutzomyia longipalpis TaxID=7200 RepID=UPI0024837C32|nr:lachesin-like [Lutzomyia longipalpis]
MNFPIIFLLTLILGCWSQQEEVPTVEISGKHVSKIGRTIDLECSTRNAGNFPVMWKKLGSDPSGWDAVFLSTGSNIILRDSRFSIKVSNDETTYKLKIKDANLHDSGKYQCAVVVSMTKAYSKVVEVVVKDATPEITKITQDLEISVGDSVDLQCSTENAGDYALIWRKGIVVISVNDILVLRDPRISVKNDHSADSSSVSTLSIKESNVGDSGTYECLVSAPDQLVKNVSLTVLLPKTTITPILADPLDSVESVSTKDAPDAQSDVEDATETANVTPIADSEHDDQA